jgi:hypothetical protein
LHSFLCKLFLVNGRPIYYAREVSCRHLNLKMLKDLVGLLDEPRIQTLASPRETSLSRILDHLLPIWAIIQQLLVLKFKWMFKTKGENYKVQRKATIHQSQIELPITTLPLHNQI